MTSLSVVFSSVLSVLFKLSFEFSTLFILLIKIEHFTEWLIFFVSEKVKAKN